MKGQSNRTRPLGRLRPLGRPGRSFGLALTGLALLALACETMPARAYRGARHYAAGNEALSAGDSARAVAELELAAELVPTASEIQNHLGLAYWAEGRMEAARVAFQTAIELDCDNRAARQNLAQLSSFECRVAGSSRATATVDSARACRREGDPDGG